MSNKKVQILLVLAIVSSIAYLAKGELGTFSQQKNVAINNIHEKPSESSRTANSVGSAAINSAPKRHSAPAKVLQEPAVVDDQNNGVMTIDSKTYMDIGLFKSDFLKLEKMFHDSVTPKVFMNYWVKLKEYRSDGTPVLELVDMMTFTKAAEKAFREYFDSELEKMNSSGTNSIENESLFQDMFNQSVNSPNVLLDFVNCNQSKCMATVSAKNKDKRIGYDTTILFNKLKRAFGSDCDMTKEVFKDGTNDIIVDCTNVPKKP